MQRSVSIEFGGTASCFATVSWSLEQQQSLEALNVLQIRTSSGTVHYVSVINQGGHHGRNRGGSVDSYVMKLHSRFGTALGLYHGELVTVKQELEPFIPTIPRAHVVCVSKDDWEILETNAETVCTSLLHQLRVIYPGLCFPFWISKTLSINLKIDKLTISSTEKEEKICYGILTENSEIIVPSHSSNDNVSTIPVKINATYRIHANTVPNCILSSEPILSLLLRNTRHVFIFKDANNAQVHDDDGFQATIRPLFDDKSTKINVIVFFIDNENPKFPDNILRYFSINNPPSIYIHPGLISEFELEEKTFVSLSTELDNDDNSKPSRISSLNERQNEVIDVPARTFGSVIENCKKFIAASLSLGIVQHGFIGPNNGALLIEGREGTGKSRVAQNIARDLEGPPYLVNWELVQCAKYRGKKPETMDKELQQILDRARRYQPSIVIFDDLDIITPKGQSLQENLLEQFLHFKICETIMDALNSQRGHQVAVIASAKSFDNLNSYWKSRQGFHFFHKVVTIPTLDAKQRLKLFSECLIQLGSEKQAGSKEIDLLTGIHDQHSTSRLIMSIAKKFISIDQEDGDELERFVEQEIAFIEELYISDKKSKNKSATEKNLKWDDVAGLSNVKEQLVKILKWPVTYKNLFKNSPIRLPSGVLLYGYPGTGKTLLGLSIPSLVNAKFIHVKGPELLSKYIGASEQAVQDVFKRARSWSPCIIFFDEFDSLVPRRGHDSTGVTDRVVNQFLAEMDGIEGGLGDGVYLIGATSRPDLIDPAVLRPGRLDKHLFFDFPNQEEASEILQTLGRKVNLRLTPKESLESIGNALKGMTGADIHSLICSAQLNAVQGYLRQLETCGEPKVNKDELTTSDIPVTFDDLKEALNSFRPSLQGSELLKFSKIYEGFSKGTTTNIGDTMGPPRATLA